MIMQKQDVFNNDKMCVQSVKDEILPYDSKVEYIESTGSQWIDFGFKSCYLDVCKAKVMLTNYTGQVFLGNYNYDDSDWRFFFVEQNSAYFDIGSPRLGPVNIQLKLNEITNIRFGYENGKMFLENLDTRTRFENTYSGSLTMPINFTAFYAKGYNKIAKGRLYEIEYRREDFVLLNTIPVRVGSVGYMYDKVSKQLFGNAGTGSFILGPDIKR